MSFLVGLVALVALAALLAWAIGSVIARVVGALLVLDSLLSLSAGILVPGRLVFGLLYLVLGAGLWLLGHRLYLAKHRRWRSALAARAFGLPVLRAMVPRPRVAV